MEAYSRKPCPYKVLQIPHILTADEIESAYKKKALLFEADKLVESGLSEPEATTKYKQLVEAYNVLSDPEKRADYDSYLFKKVLADAAALVKDRDERRGRMDYFDMFGKRSKERDETRARMDYEINRKRSREMMYMIMEKRAMETGRRLY